jgi:hypothetical protein
LMDLLRHVRLLPGRALVRRGGPGYWWGEVVEATGYLTGTKVGFGSVEATFQKGKSHYAVVLIRNMRKERP